MGQTLTRFLSQKEYRGLSGESQVVAPLNTMHVRCRFCTQIADMPGVCVMSSDYTIVSHSHRYTVLHTSVTTVRRL